MAISALSMKTCASGEGSIPGWRIHVMIAIQTTEPMMIHVAEFAPWVQLKSRYVYCDAITESDAITITSATKIAQPLIQPIRGPKARVVHAKVVPASGSALFR